jgi:Tfp pilus assembly protein PilN
LAAAIGRLTGLACEGGESKPSRETSSESGAISVYLHEVSARRATMRPAAGVARAASRRLRQALVAGVCVAVGLMGYDAATTHALVQSEREEVRKLEASLMSLEPAAMVGQRAELAAREAALAEARVRESLGGVPEWSVVLSSLATSTPDGVELMSIELAMSNGAATGRLRGRVREVADGSRIQGYMRSLRASPVFGRPGLGPMRRVDSARGQLHEFEVSIPVITLPGVAIVTVGPTEETAADETTGGRP